jgi:hypothetical protein
MMEHSFATVKGALSKEQGKKLRKRTGRRESRAERTYTLYTIPAGQTSLRSNKPKKPADMSGRQWVRARKALRQAHKRATQMVGVSAL